MDNARKHGNFDEETADSLYCRSFPAYSWALYLLLAYLTDVPSISASPSQFKIFISRHHKIHEENPQGRKI